MCCCFMPALCILCSSGISCYSRLCSRNESDPHLRCTVDWCVLLTLADCVSLV
ncbi:hypothetical protein KC19_7G147800 [Ceratodon purpureus]|uniref:Uncharacterized protein n=1 Tax=Ceratodon purpureus TaxID=3225 RepID=A0A8T0HB44_CERPU|nr:hypothetical protein KC19_7G147800 [Ceratodon purpureus]